MTNRIATTKQPRAAARINSKLDKNLGAYMAVASAAGVALLSAAQPAEGKVVYTPANVTLGHNSNYLLDLNHDGIPDFEIKDFFTQFARFPLGDHTNVLSVAPLRQANRVVEMTSGGRQFAAALPARTQVGPNSPFQAGYSAKALASSGGSAYSTVLFGPWFKHPKAYVGVKFTIHGITHYGWVRVTVSSFIENYTIVGYAYEMVPNQPISTGQTSGPTVVSAIDPREMLVPSQPPATLGLLALGADAIAVWRRDEEKCNGVIVGNAVAI